MPLEGRVLRRTVAENIALNHPLMLMLAWIVFVSGFCGLLVSYGASVLYPRAPALLEYGAACFLAGALISGIVLMIASTFVAMRYKGLPGLVRFVAITWIIPYFGVSMYLLLARYVAKDRGK